MESRSKVYRDGRRSAVAPGSFVSAANTLPRRPSLDCASGKLTPFAQTVRWRRRLAGDRVGRAMATPTLQTSLIGWWSIRRRGSPFLVAL